ncbi:MAG: peptidase, partial [Acidimicrobiia bacterium]
MTSTIRLGRIRGIEIGIHWSLLLIGGLLAYTLATSVLPDLEPDAGGSYWAAAILATAMFFASVLAHELAHSFVAQRR